MACATIRTLRPLTRTSTDRTRSPSVSRICFSILRLTDASVTGFGLGCRPSAAPFRRSSSTRHDRESGLAGAEGSDRAFPAGAAEQGADERKQPACRRPNCPIERPAPHESSRLAIARASRWAVPSSSASRLNRAGRRAARSSSESVHRADHCAGRAADCPGASRNGDRPCDGAASTGADSRRAADRGIRRPRRLRDRRPGRRTRPVARARHPGNHQHRPDLRTWRSRLIRASGGGSGGGSGRWWIWPGSRVGGGSGGRGSRVWLGSGGFGWFRLGRRRLKWRRILGKRQAGPAENERQGADQLRA